MEKPPQTVVAAVARETVPKIAPLRQPFPVLLWGWGETERWRDGRVGRRDGGMEERREGRMERAHGWMDKRRRDGWKNERQKKGGKEGRRNKKMDGDVEK